MLKRCSKCQLEKSPEEFNFEKANRDKLSRWCKKCFNEANRLYRIKNKEYLSVYNKRYLKIYYRKNAEKIKKNSKEYGLLHKEEIKERTKQYRLKNKQILYERNKNYRIKNLEVLKIKSRKYVRERREKDRDYRLLCNLRLRLWHALNDHHKYIKSDRTLKLIGCSLEELKSHLQNTAVANGFLNFDINNYSSKEYEIDHIVPCKMFHLSCPYHQRLCFNYTNLQVLTSTQNARKLIKIPDLYKMVA